jgi:hypothetical protein
MKLDHSNKLGLVFLCQFATLGAAAIPLYIINVADEDNTSTAIVLFSLSLALAEVVVVIMVWSIARGIRKHLRDQTQQLAGQTDAADE